MSYRELVLITNITPGSIRYKRNNGAVRTLPSGGSIIIRDSWGPHKDFTYKILNKVSHKKVYTVDSVLTVINLIITRVYK